VELAELSCGRTGNLDDVEALEGLRAILEDPAAVGSSDSRDAFGLLVFGGDPGMALFRVFATGRAGRGPLGGGWIEGREGCGSVVVMELTFDMDEAEDETGRGASGRVFFRRRLSDDRASEGLGLGRQVGRPQRN
jgi:hypothetical protein